MFLKNYWSVIAWDFEIKQKPFARTVCGDRIASCGTSTSTPAASVRGA